MSECLAAREDLTALCRSLYERGLTGGTSGNASIRLPDGGMLITPTRSSFGWLRPENISRLDAEDALVSGLPPSKEWPLHRAIYTARPDANAVIHLHCLHAVAVSCLTDIDPADALPALTPYYRMQVGRLPVAPYHAPGSPGLMEAVAALAPRHTAMLLANHGPIVAGSDLFTAVAAMEELEATARLYLTVRNLPYRVLDA